jgi:hypothetical protein
VFDACDHFVCRGSTVSDFQISAILLKVLGSILFGTNTAAGSRLWIELASQLHHSFLFNISCGRGAKSKRIVFEAVISGRCPSTTEVC